MIHNAQKYQRLVDLISTRTAESKIDWEWKNSIDLASAWLNSRRISIKKTKNDDDEDLYIVSINNGNGDTIESFTDEDITPPFETRPAKDNYYLILEALYTRIKRQVSGADVALDEILKDLESGMDFTDGPF